MPVNYDDYPPEWLTEIRPRILERAGHRCECRGICGDEHGDRCEEEHGQPARWAGGQLGLLGPPPRPMVVLTVAHLDHDREHNADGNLAALCQRCHLRLDRVQHAENAARSRLEARGRTLPGQVSIWGGEE